MRNQLSKEINNEIRESYLEGDCASEAIPKARAMRILRM